MHAKLVQLSLQGQWIRWCDCIHVCMPQPSISFCFGATYDTLPSLSNLYRWHIAPEAVCFLCSKQVCTIAHILGACRLALQQGRFTICHDAVLRVLVPTMKGFLTLYQVSKTNFSFMKFVKAGARLPNTSKKNNCGLLHSAPDWVLLSDLESTLVVRPAIPISQLRSDILLYSTTKKTVIILELTYPCEENMESLHAAKFEKYDSFCSAIKAKGWSIHFFAVKIGLLAYCASTIRSCLMHLGLTRKLVKSSPKRFSSAVLLTASFQIWLCLESQECINSNADEGITPATMQSSITNPPRHSKSRLPFQHDNKKYHVN